MNMVFPGFLQQKEEFLSFSVNAYVPEDFLEKHIQEDILLRKSIFKRTL